MRYCIFCGVNIPPDAKFCQICGKKQPEDAKAVNNESLEEEKKEGLAAFLDSPKKMIIAGIGAFIVIFIITTAIMFAVLS